MKTTYRRRTPDSASLSLDYTPRDGHYWAPDSCRSRAARSCPEPRLSCRGTRSDLIPVPENRAALASTTPSRPCQELVCNRQWHYSDEGTVTTPNRTVCATAEAAAYEGHGLVSFLRYRIPAENCGART